MIQHAMQFFIISYNIIFFMKIISGCFIFYEIAKITNMFWRQYTSFSLAKYFEFYNMYNE